MRQFDMVIVDGPPVLGLADAPLLSGVCRGT
jgi:succinoglycan biosynthesis transport protein ExoP